MVTALKIKDVGPGLTMRYRPNSTDEQVIREVIEKRTYYRPSIGFKIEAGEHWLDLGANIGAFAVYCLLHGAKADCYEPEPSCFNLLQRNARSCRCFMSAVTVHRDPKLQLWVSSKANNYYRGTVLNNPRAMLSKTPIVIDNTYVGDLPQTYDGAKLDIEGAELDMIDKGLLPKCDKLCLEYHTSRDDSMDNLQRRLTQLKKLFKEVSYTKELDKIISLGGRQKPWQDRVIFCVGRRVR